VNVLACTVFTVHSQNVFNHFVDIPIYPDIRNVIVVDSGYIVAGGNWNPNLNVFIGYVDLQGNLVNYKSYGDSVSNWFHGLQGSLIKTTDGGFVIAGSTNNTCLFFKFDNNLDTVWKKEYEIPTVTLLYGCGEIETGYGLVGYWDDGVGGFPQMLLIKTDKQGNYQWKKLYGGQYLEVGFKMISTTDGGFLLGGDTNSYCPQADNLSSAQDWYFVKTDSIGTVQWWKHYGNPYLSDGIIGRIIQTHDSCYVINGYNSTSLVNFVPHTKKKSCVMKLNKYGNIIWKKLYEDDAECVESLAIVENEDGTLSFIGNDKYNYNILYKLNSTGDIIWRRKIMTPGINPDDAILLHMANTPDGGYILVGYGGGFQTGAYQRGWIVKTDSMGCDGYLSCQDTALAMHVTPAETTIILGNSIAIKTFIDNGKAPVTVSYSTNDISYPVYISCPDASDSIVITPISDTVIYVAASYQFNNCVTDSAVIHVINDPGKVEELASGNWLNIYPNPATDFITITCDFKDAYTQNIEIISSDGKLLRTVNTDQNTRVIHFTLNDLPGGIYYVKTGYVIKKLIILK
jgi:hypothetical protein